MCSPQQAVGAPSLTQEIDDLKATSDAQTQRDTTARTQALDGAEQSARRDQRQALIRAGRRFGRSKTLGQSSSSSSSSGGAIRGALDANNFQRRALGK